MNLKANNTELENPKWDIIKLALNQMDGRSNGHIILENKKGDYLQCAGWTEKMTVEYRINSEPNFKHYVIGKGGNKSPLKVTWVSMQTNIGAIMIHKEEVLGIKDAELIFKEFHKNYSIPMAFNMRNVTKLHV